MGKASRRKRDKDRPDALSRDAARDVRSFFSRVGLIETSSRDQAWANVEHLASVAFADELADTIDGRGSTPIYEVMYRDPQTALACATLMAPLTRRWLAFWAMLSLPDGDVLDLGSGSGVNTCFYAIKRPDVRVVGVERSELGVDCAQHLARRLGLSNVEFKQGDASSYLSDDRFGVITSSLVAHEGGDRSFGGEDPGFSTLGVVPALLSGSTSPLAETAAKSLAGGGAYISMERVSGLDVAGRWLGAINAAGLGIDWASCGNIVADLPLTGTEQLPVFCATQDGARATGEDLVNWWQQNKDLAPETETELWLSEQETVSFVAGLHIDILDDDGEGQTRYYVLETDGAVALYMTTSRGWREVLALVEPGERETVLSQLEAMRAQIAGAGGVVGYRELTNNDLPAILPTASADPTNASSDGGPTAE